MKHVTFKKQLCLALAVIMLLGTLAIMTACADSGDDTPDAAETTTTAPGANIQPEGGDSADTAPADTTTEVVPDALPSLDYKQEQIDFLAWKQGVLEYYAEEQNGDAVNDALYYRNITVEERLNIKLEFNEIKGNSSAFQEYCQTVMTMVNAGDASYDALACYLRSAGVLTLQHGLEDLLSVEYIDFTQPWWPSSLTELNTVNDKLYFMSGDIATSLLYQMMFMIYNTKLGTDLAQEDPQALALEGKWTQDKLIEMAAGAYSDLDTSGSKTEGDQYGLFAYQHPNLDIFYMGAGLNYLVTTDSGELVLSDDILSEKSYSIIDKFNTLFYSSNDGFFTKSVSDAAIIEAGVSLFYNITGQLLTQRFYNSEMSYSILPAPKYDESQASYLTPVAFTHSMYCIPVSAAKADMSGAVLECMASEGYRQVTPALFESSFKYKYSKGENDAKIFEFIRSGVVFDIGRPFFDELGGDSSSPIRIWRQQIENGVNRLSSSSKTYLRRWETAVDNINKGLLGE